MFGWRHREPASAAALRGADLSGAILRKGSAATLLSHDRSSGKSRVRADAWKSRCHGEAPALLELRAVR